MSLALHDQLAEVLQDSASLLAGTDAEPEISQLITQLDGPLVVAIQGEVSSGKSTLLNALLGARLSRTRLTTCTRSVTYYELGEPELWVHLADGGAQQLAYDGGPLPDELDRYEPDEVDYLRVSAPNLRLDGVSLVDFPGFNTMTEESKVAMRKRFAADAFIYVADRMTEDDQRHLEDIRRRADQYGVCALNQVAVLGRVDLIGGAIEQLDPLEQAVQIAERYAERFASIVSTIVPVAALLAESVTSGDVDQTLFDAVRELAGSLDDDAAKYDLRGQAMFKAADLSLDDATRQRLISLLDMYAIRRLVAEADQLAAVDDVQRRLMDWSGLDELERVIFEQFVPTSRETKLAMTLARTRDLLGRSHRLLDGSQSGARRDLIDRLNDLSVHEGFHRLHEANALMLCGQVEPGDGLDETEVVRLITGSTRAERLGLPPTADGDELTKEAIDGYLRWRERRGIGYSSPMQQIAATIQTTYLGLR